LWSKSKAHAYCQCITSNVRNADLVVYVVTIEIELLTSFVSVVINTQYSYIFMTHIEHFGSYLHLYSWCDTFRGPARSLLNSRLTTVLLNISIKYQKCVDKYVIEGKYLLIHHSLILSIVDI